MIFLFIDETEACESKKTKNESENTSSEVISGNVIDISDCEEEETDYSFRGNSMSQDSFRYKYLRIKLYMVLIQYKLWSQLLF